MLTVREINRQNLKRIHSNEFQFQVTNNNYANESFILPNSRSTFTSSFFVFFWGTNCFLQFSYVNENVINS